jgi:hypothetical protein
MTAKQLVTEILEGTPNVVLKCQDDEPVFVLVGRDKLAADVVRKWANAYRMATGPTSTKGAPGSVLDKLNEARDCADQMDAWRAAHGGGKLPD